VQQQQPAPPPPQWGAQQPGYQAAPVPMVNDPRKSKMAAGLLGIFLGAFGVHNFYLGYTGKAIAQLLITVLSCGILAIVSSIWGLVEGIMILTGSINTDAAGVPLKD
jgi:TM2 domain-containing membrane protein YozV